MFQDLSFFGHGDLELGFSLWYQALRRSAMVFHLGAIASIACFFVISDQLSFPFGWPIVISRLFHILVSGVPCIIIFQWGHLISNERFLHLVLVIPSTMGFISIFINMYRYFTIAQFPVMAPIISVYMIGYFTFLKVNLRQALFLVALVLGPYLSLLIIIRALGLISTATLFGSFIEYLSILVSGTWSAYLTEVSSYFSKFKVDYSG
jgi:hypothetical protein